MDIFRFGRCVAQLAAAFSDHTVTLRDSVVEVRIVSTDVTPWLSFGPPSKVPIVMVGYPSEFSVEQLEAIRDLVATMKLPAPHDGRGPG